MNEIFTLQKEKKLELVARPHLCLFVTRLALMHVLEYMEYIYIFMERLWIVVDVLLNKDTSRCQWRYCDQSIFLDPQLKDAILCLKLIAL